MQPLTRFVQQSKQQARKTPFITARPTFGVLLFLVVVSTFVYTYTRPTTPVLAATSSTFNFQARLMTGVGSIVPDGYYNVEFKLYDGGTDGGPAGTGQANAGTNLWTETYYDSNGGTAGNDNRVQVKSGYLTVNLGSQTAFPGTINWDQELWLTMNIGGTTQTATPTWDGEMLSATNTRIKLTAVPYAFKAGQANALTITGGTVTGDSLAQLAPGALQTVNSSVAGLRINQTGSGGLLQLAVGGVDEFTVSNTGDGTFGGSLSVSGGSVGVGNASQTGTLTLYDGVGGQSILQSGVAGLGLTTSGNFTIGTSDTNATLLVLDAKTSAGDPTGTNGAMYYNAAVGKFRCYQGGQWQDCINGANNNSTASFVSGLANVAGTTTGAVVEAMVFTSATAVSTTAGVTGFTAPAAGSFRTCLVKNNAAITAGTLNVRWRVNGVSVGAAACPMNATTNRQSATALDPGVVTFAAGDTIGLAFDTVGMTPAATNDFTVYWTVEYNATSAASNNATIQSAYNASTATELVLDGTRSGLTIRDNGSPIGGNLLEIQDNSGASTYFGVTASGVNISNTLTIAAGGIDNNLAGIVDAGSVSGIGNLTGAGALVVSSGAGGDLTLDSASNALILSATDTVLRRSAAGTFGIDLADGADTILELGNSGAGVAGLNLSDGGLSLAGTVVLTNAGVLQNVTANTSILTAGLLGTARGGTGIDGSGATNGQLLIGNGSGYSLGSLSNNGGLTITTGAGTLGLAVNYGATSTTAVRGDTALTCTSGSGNLSGGGTSITLGNGGSCAAIDTITNPTFGTSVTTPALSSSGALSISSAALNDLSFTSSSGFINMNATTLKASASLTFDIVSAGGQTLSIGNSGAGTASLNMLDGDIAMNGTAVINNARALSNLTGISSSGSVALSSLSSGGMVKAAATTGTLSVATAGTDYELPLTFANGLTRSSNSIALGGNLTSATDIGLNGNALTITGSGGSVFTALAAGGVEVRADSAAALKVVGTGGASYLTVNTTGNIVQVGSSTTDATGILSVLDSYNNATDPAGVNGASYYNTARNAMRCYENSTWKNCIDETTVVKTADQTVTNNATFQNDTFLSFAMVTNSSYTVDAAINFTTTSAAADFKYTFTAPAGAAVYLAAEGPTAANTSTICNIAASGQTCTLLVAANYRGTIRVTGYVRTGGTAGNLQFQFAQNTQTAGQSVTVYQGSMLAYRKTQ